MDVLEVFQGFAAPTDYLKEQGYRNDIMNGKVYLTKEELEEFTEYLMKFMKGHQEDGQGKKPYELYTFLTPELRYLRRVRDRWNRERE